MAYQEKRIAELEKQLADLKKGREGLSVMEETRKRLYGYVRDGMASKGGKIIG